MPAAVTTGLDALRANPMRTLLSTIGVVMGAGSLAAVLSLGDGAESFARERIAGEGMLRVRLEAITSDLVDGQRLPRPAYPLFTAADAELVSAALPDAGVRLEVTGTALTGCARQFGAPQSCPAGLAALPGQPRAVQLLGIRPARVEASPPLAAGRWFTDDELRSGARVLVVTARTAVALSAGRPAEPGAVVALGGLAFRLVGITPDQPGARGLVGTAPLDALDDALVPVPQPRARAVVVTVPVVEHTADARHRLESLIAARPAWQDQVRVVAHGEERLRQATQGILIMKLLLGAFTSISLLVGGIGIMNVLLASVAERTREIGIRKAVGARRRDVLLQFLTESIAISSTGSLLGVVAGIGGAYLVTAIVRARTEAPMYASVSVSTLIVSALAALLVGLVFGTYPALRAARLSPIDAIQRE